MQTAPDPRQVPDADAIGPQCGSPLCSHYERLRIRPADPPLVYDAAQEARVEVQTQGEGYGLGADLVRASRHGALAYARRREDAEYRGEEYPGPTPRQGAALVAEMELARHGHSTGHTIGEELMLLIGSIVDAVVAPD